MAQFNVIFYSNPENWIEIPLAILPESICIPIMQMVWTLRVDAIDAACLPWGHASPMPTIEKKAKLAESIFMN